MEMLRFPGTSSSVWAPKIVALMGLSPLDLPTLQRERLCFLTGQLPRAEPWPSVRPGRAGSGVLRCSCQLKACCISFMSNHLVENQKEKKKNQTQILFCPFASVLKELNAPNTQGLALGEGGAGPCPAGCDQLHSPRVAEPGFSLHGSIFRLCNGTCICF